MPADGDTSGGAASAGAGAAPNAPPPPASAPGPSTTAAPADPPPLTDTALLASFFAEVRSADRDAEVDRVLGAFKLNPYEQVGCRFDATDAEVTRAYRKASLLVHPDKCAHPRAQDAFEVLNAAVAVLRGTGGGTPEEGAARLKELRYVLDYCKDQVLAARAASLKSDAVARLAATVVEGGADAVQAAWEASDAFREAWQAKARDVLARTAFKRQKLVARLKEAAHREEAEAAAVSAETRAAATASKKWEADREARVGTWRDFARGGGDKDTGGGRKKKKRAGGAAAPAAGALPFGLSAPVASARPAGVAAAVAAAVKPPPPKRARSGDD